VDLAYLFVSVFICFINSGKKIEKKNQMVWSCHPLLQLNHFAQKTEAKKVYGLRMTILMQNWKFQSRSYGSSCLMGLRMVALEALDWAGSVCEETSINSGVSFSLKT
jgi:hypothetical protein